VVQCVFLEGIEPQRSGNKLYPFAIANPFTFLWRFPFVDFLLDSVDLLLHSCRNLIPSTPFTFSTCL